MLKNCWCILFFGFNWKKIFVTQIIFHKSHNFQIWSKNLRKHTKFKAALKFQLYQKLKMHQLLSKEFSKLCVHCTYILRENISFLFVFLPFCFIISWISDIVLHTQTFEGFPQFSSPLLHSYIIYSYFIAFLAFIKLHMLCIHFLPQYIYIYIYIYINPFFYIFREFYQIFQRNGHVATSKLLATKQMPSSILRPAAPCLRDSQTKWRGAEVEETDGILKFSLDRLDQEVKIIILFSFYYKSGRFYFLELNIIIFETTFWHKSCLWRVKDRRINFISFL